MGESWRNIRTIPIQVKVDKGLRGSRTACPEPKGGDSARSGRRAGGRPGAIIRRRHRGMSRFSRGSWGARDEHGDRPVPVVLRHRHHPRPHPGPLAPVRPALARPGLERPAARRSRGAGGISALRRVGRTGWSLESVAGLLLVVFGLGYGIWAHRREARAHRPESGPPSGNAGHVHVHGHLLERWFHGALSGGALVAIIGISPCALLVPVLLAASAEGPGTLLAAGLGFAVCTILTMLTVALCATRGMRRIDLPFFTRYGDLASGLLIAAIGLLVLRLEG